MSDDKDWRQINWPEFRSHVPLAVFTPTTYQSAPPTIESINHRIDLLYCKIDRLEAVVLELTEVLKLKAG